MSADAKAAEVTPRAARVGLGLGGAAVALVSILGSVTAGLVILLALLGTPLFAIMGGSSELLWLTHPDPAYHHLRFIAPNVLDERFADSPILVTIPLFTFVGYVMAESKTPDRLVRGRARVLRLAARRPRDRVHRRERLLHDAHRRQRRHHHRDRRPALPGAAQAEATPRSSRSAS